MALDPGTGKRKPSKSLYRREPPRKGAGGFAEAAVQAVKNDAATKKAAPTVAPGIKPPIVRPAKIRQARKLLNDSIYSKRPSSEVGKELAELQASMSDAERKRAKAILDRLGKQAEKERVQGLEKLPAVLGFGELAKLAPGGTPAREFDPLWGGIEAASVFPFARAIRGTKLAVDAGTGTARKAAKGVRTLKAGEATVQIPTARSRVTRALIEGPADKVSRALDGDSVAARAIRKAEEPWFMPKPSNTARFAKHAGRRNTEEARRAKALQFRATKTINAVKEGSREDIAHFWWRQLPAGFRNAEGLQRVRAARKAELDDVVSGKTLADLQRQLNAASAARYAAQTGGRVEAVGEGVLDVGVVVRAADRDNVGRILSLDGGTAVVRFVNRVEGTMADVALPTSSLTSSGMRVIAGAADDAARDAELVHKLLRQEQELKTLIDDVPFIQRDLTASIAKLDWVLKKTPKVNPKVLDAMESLYGDRANVLVAGGLLKPERAAERAGLVSRWLDLPEDGAGYVGHRLHGRKVKGSRPSGMPVSVGAGRVRLPEGVSRENKLMLAKKGRVRESTRVAVEDWQAAQVYRTSVTARKDLGEMGRKFDGTIADDEIIVNPKGRAIPPWWRTGGQIPVDEQEVAEAAADVVATYMPPPDIVARIRQGGRKADEALKEWLGDTAVRWDELRVVKEKTAQRYYGQFQPAGKGTWGGAVYDAAVDFTAMSIVFFRAGYIPKNIVQNLVMSVPHQGPLFLVNAPRAVQALANGKLRHLLASEMGGGATAALAEEARLKKGLEKTAGVITSVADTPFRVSALLHELSATKLSTGERVIGRFKPYLDDADIDRLYRVLTDPGEREALNNAMWRARDAMADFNRMTPTQRKWARKFFVIPGWLVAGSRYPVHFAATHPGRSAAMAYVAAGEPGLPDEYKLNKPIDEYFERPLDWATGIPTPWGLWRTNSLSPVSTPAEIGLAIAGRGDRSVGDYANPLFSTLWDVAHKEVRGPNGAYPADWGTVLEKAGERLVPNVKLGRETVNPNEDSKYYPEDRTWLGRWKREIGIIPIEVTGEGEKPATGSRTSRRATPQRSSSRYSRRRSKSVYGR